MSQDKSTIKEAVRKQYGAVALSGQTSCCAPSCCAPSPNAEDTSKRLGYSEDEVTGVVEGANLGLGCGNPQAIAALSPGETVLDLGSGAGFDAFLAAKAVGPTGKVIGVDMTREMLARARRNAASTGADNVEFRLGEIEDLPVDSDTVDVIMSNCVINLSPDKAAVFREAFRVLRTGGRLAISDVVATKPLPDALRDDVELHVGCMAGAATVSDLQEMLADAGFGSVSIDTVPESREFIAEWAPGTGVEDYVVSASITAIKTEA